MDGMTEPEARPAGDRAPHALAGLAVVVVPRSAVRFGRTLAKTMPRRVWGLAGHRTLVRAELW